ncbi:MAG: hypothetical protein PUG83_02995, partial [Clostridiaceae bacterium]|nr:hypothetical protein [Clostridiaceae bacterium]
FGYIQPYGRRLPSTKAIFSFRREVLLFSLRVQFKEGVLPMEYLVILFLILVASTAYIESSKNKSNKK